jgi:hypothetical protein
MLVRLLLFLCTAPLARRARAPNRSQKQVCFLVSSRHTPFSLSLLK